MEYWNNGVMERLKNGMMGEWGIESTQHSSTPLLHHSNPTRRLYARHNESSTHLRF
jgi:hypothetical protein